MDEWRSDSKEKPCDGTRCEEGGPHCVRCGFNPQEVKRRKRRIRKKGLTQIGDTRRLIIAGRKK